MRVEKPKTKGGRRLFSRVEAARAGLNYVSETDSPIEAVFFEKAGGISAEKLRKALGLPAASVVKEVSFDEFFAPLTAPRPWHTPKQKKNAKGFAGLEALLEKELRGLTVFRVGRVRIEIYIVGVDPEGNWFGVRTEAVET